MIAPDGSEQPYDFSDEEAYPEKWAEMERQADEDRRRDCELDMADEEFVS